ncbi:MAG: response regulator [Chitinophagaceae bacterium]|nr:MAG: response regulator [Chitinophagaceae bacterium]
MHPVTILLVDDDLDDLEILSSALLKSGAGKVNCVYTCAEAYKYLREATLLNTLPQLIITDHYLPDIIGTAFISDLSIIPEYKDIPVMVLSTQQSASDRDKYQKMGVVDFFTKPNTEEEYLVMAKRVVDRLR